VAKTFLDLLTAYGPVLAVILQAFLLSRFLDGRNRNYPLAILYSVLLFSLTAVVVLWQNGASWLTSLLPVAAYTNVLSGMEVLMHIVLLILMLQLINDTHRERSIPLGRTWILAGLAAITFAVSVYWVSDLISGARFNRVRQVMSFFMVLLNLYWWTLLLGSKKVSRRIMLLSTGIGLQMTGQVIGDGVLSFIKTNDQYGIIILSFLIMFLTHYCSLGTWYEAFNPKNAPQPAGSLSMALPKARG
jgi:hypothetical protein